MPSQFFNKENESMNKFKEGLSRSAYLNSGDIDEKGVKIRIIPWLFNDQPEELVPYYEGWEEYQTEAGKGKKAETKSRPRRFTLDEEIPDGINWKVSQNTFSKKMEAQTPKQAIGFLAYVYGEKRVKLAGFAQATIVKSFIGMKDPGSELYCEELSTTDIIIKRKTESEGKGFVVTFAPQSKAELPEEAVKILEAGYLFSWAAFMAGEDPFEEGLETANVLKEVVAAMNGGEKKQDKPKANKNTKAEITGNEEELKDWRNVKMSNGKTLGSLSLDKLQQLKANIEDKKQTQLPLYHFVKYGVAHFEDSDESTEFVIE
jgi:hypothetical protein